MSFSFQERRKRKLFEFRKRIEELENMDEIERSFEYITLKSAYEHKKSILTLLVITLALSMLMNLWKNFFLFVEGALNFGANFANNEREVTTASLLMVIIFFILLTILIVNFVAGFMSDIRRIQKELMIIDMVEKKKQKL